MRFPRWFVRWVVGHGADWTEAEFEAWATKVTPTFMRGTLQALENLDWRVVRFDPATEPGERPIVVNEMTAKDLEGVH